METSHSIAEYKDGFIKGIPVCLAYLSVSFTFGIMAESGGMPVWLAVFTSFSNLTSAGQFAGLNLIFEGATYFEIALTTLIINLRYMLMSLSLSQKIEEGTPLWKRLIFGYAVTDEIFAIASVEKKKISASYMFGIMTTPVLGWTFGTFLGAVASEIMPARLASAMGIALYAMFIALIIPPAKKSRPVLITAIDAVIVTCLFEFIPIFAFISDGFRIILATIISAAISAAAFPVEDDADVEASVDESADIGAGASAGMNEGASSDSDESAGASASAGIDAGADAGTESECEA